MNGYTYIAVPSEHSAEVALDLGPKYAYDLKFPDVEQHPLHTQFRVDRRLLDDEGRWGTIVGFGIQPLGEHIVVKFDGAPEDRESFVLFSEVRQLDDLTLGPVWAAE